MLSLELQLRIGQEEILTDKRRKLRKFELHEILEGERII